jgi:hypothetical protein
MLYVVIYTNIQFNFFLMGSDQKNDKFTEQNGNNILPTIILCHQTINTYENQ